MNQHLFIFTIGPVQSFIMQARKTQDLFAGSRLLSDLIKYAVGETFKQGGKIIFPFVKDIDALQHMASLPNRFVAEFAQPREELKSIGEQIENSIRTKFGVIADELLLDVIKPENKQYPAFYPKYKKQVEQHLNLHWLFLPFTPETYPEKFLEIERLLGAIKNVRAFEQNEEQGRKCSVDGERNALVFKRNYKGKNSKDGNKPSYIDQAAFGVPKDDFRLSQGEGLSAISTIKRLYNPQKEHFPSTAEVALMNDRLLLDEEGEKRFTSFQNLFEEKGFILECLKIKKKIEFDNASKDFMNDFMKDFDYQLLFEENINEKQIPNAEQLACAKEIFPSLKNYFKTKYYALIAFDVDNMGKWLSGEYLKDRADLRQFHESLSAKLLEYGKWAESYLQAPKGRVVYAGGDDFLGFVNIQHLFEVMQELRTRFDEIVNCAEVLTFIEDDEHITFSAGVVVAHYKTPARVVLKKTKAAEQVAKIDGNKNAFAISVLKHSGDTNSAYAKWSLSESFVFDGRLFKGNSSRLQFIIEKLQKSHSNTFIKSLNRELPALVDRQGLIYNESILRAETKRLIQRSAQPDCSLEDTKMLNEQTIHLFEEDGVVANFLELLNIADFLKNQIT